MLRLELLEESKALNNYNGQIRQLGGLAAVAQDKTHYRYLAVTRYDYRVMER